MTSVPKKASAPTTPAIATAAEVSAAADMIKTMLDSGQITFGQYCALNDRVAKGQGRAGVLAAAYVSKFIDAPLYERLTGEIGGAA